MYFIVNTEYSKLILRKNKLGIFSIEGEEKDFR